MLNNNKNVNPGIKIVICFCIWSEKSDVFFCVFLNLGGPNWAIALIAGVLQYWQGKMLAPKKTQKKTSDFSDQMQKQMTIFMPGFTFLLLLSIPSALGLYWITTTLFTIIQQYFVFKADNNTK